jgi:hypothetical protein
MAIGLDVGDFAEEMLFAGQELTQFEPDPDGDGSTDAATSPAPDDEAADPQWVVFPDAADEVAWAAMEPLVWSA